MKTTDRDVSTNAPLTGAGAQRLPSWLSRDWFWALILILVVILVYQPVWYAGFIWDDDTLVTANPSIVGPLGLKEIWTTSAADICPLTITTFWVEYALWGLAPLPYHLVNVFIHGACAVVLWRALRSLQVPGAWLGAALWALHPLEVESVAWIAEMKNTESCLFYLLTILFFVRGLKIGGPGNRSGGHWNYALSLMFAALAMASKSSTVILPIVLCLCAWWMEGRWLWRNVAKVGPVFLMSIAAGVVSMWTQNLQIVNASTPVQSWPERLVTAGDVVWFYLGKLLWPHPLITIYPRWEIDAGRWVSYLPLLAVIIVLFIFWLKRESWSRPWFFAFAYFLTALLPVLGLVTISYAGLSFVADHLQYLASIGPLALAGAELTRFSNFALSRRPWLQPTLCAGLLLILGTVSWRQIWIYQTRDTLWTHTLSQYPNSWWAYRGLGFDRLDKRQVDEAIGFFQKSLSLAADSTRPTAYHNLGVAFAEKGLIDKAIAQYEEALVLNPNYAEAHFKLGDALLQKGQVDEAIEQFQKTLKIAPSSALAHDNLGAALFRKGQVDEAIEQFQKAVELDPYSAKAHNNLGLALGQKGQADEALDQFQKALAINPSYAEAHNNLGIAFAKKGQADEALAQFQEALRLRPDDRAAQINLAKIKAMIQKKAASP